MDFVTMESFVTLCECKNFTKAADQLYISQPALSKRIAALESELQMSLIDRSANGFTLTVAGRTVRDEFIKMLQLRFETNKRIEDMRLGITTNLRIGIVKAFPSAIFIPCIEAMSVLHPEVELMFQGIADNDSASKKILYKELDVALCLRQDVSAYGLHYRMILHMPPYALIGKTHPLFNHTELSISDLLPEKLIFPRNNASPHEHPIAKYYEKLGYNHRSIVYTESIEALCAFVATGKYIGISSMRALAKTQFVSEHIRLIPIVEADLTGGDLCVAYKPNNLHAEAFSEILVNYKHYCGGDFKFGETV